MGLSMFSSNASPIAIDFGSSSVKLLQIAAGERPRLVAAAEVVLPDSVRGDIGKRMEHYAQHLPAALNEAGFKGKRAVISVPCTQTLVQHMQISPVQGSTNEDLIKGQLQAQMGYAPENVVVRSTEVTTVHRGGQPLTEVICFAIARETVMRLIALLKKMKLNVVGVQTSTLGMVRAFDHINRRASDDEVTNLYIDLGWAGTQVAISHGRDLVFARHIQFGGRLFDQHVAEALHCDITSARAHRLAMDSTVPSRSRQASGGAHTGNAILQAATEAHGATQPAAEDVATATDERRGDTAVPTSCTAVPEGESSTSAGSVNLTEPLDMITDELNMCLRYHRGLFPERTIDRAIFVGGEARQLWLCQQVVKAMGVPAQLGDPLSRLDREGKPRAVGFEIEEAQPGWAVAYGLCTAPTDL